MSYRNVLKRKIQTVLVVGCGGTGAFVADGLCRILPKDVKIVLQDPDTVEERNLRRQFFSRHDLGLLKAEALANRLADFYGREIFYSKEPFDGTFDQSAPAPGLVIGCVDNATARGCLNSKNHMYDCWYIDAGNDEYTGQVFIGNRCAEKYLFGPDFFVGLPMPALQCPELLIPTVAPVRACAEAVERDEQSPVINQWMASLVLLFVHKFMLSELTWMAAYIDLKSGTLTPVQVDPKRVAKVLGVRVDSLIQKVKEKEKT